MRAQLALIGSSLMVSALLAEVVVRGLGLGTANISRGALHEYDPDAGWICARNLDAHYVKPGSFDVRILCNGRGLRDSEEHPFAKPAGQRRIAVLGDSFMWGWGLEQDETVASRLERGLANTVSLNLAANGYSTVQSLVRLETEGLRYAPDVVVYAFVSNDLDGNFDDKEGGRPVVALDPKGEAVVVNRPVRRHWKAPVKQWLRHRSRLFGLLEYAAELWKLEWKSLRARWRPRQEPAGAEGAGSGRPAADDESSVSFLELYGPPGARVDRVWSAERALLARLAQRSAGAGAELLVVYVSLRSDVSQAAFREVAASQGLDPDDPSLDLDVDRLRRRLAAICRELGIRLVDPTARLRSAEDPDALYLTNDGHWSPAGSRRAAAALLAALADGGGAAP